MADKIISVMISACFHGYFRRACNNYTEHKINNVTNLVRFQRKTANLSNLRKEKGRWESNSGEGRKEVNTTLQNVRKRIPF